MISLFEFLGFVAAFSILLFISLVIIIGFYTLYRKNSVKCILEDKIAEYEKTAIRQHAEDILKIDTLEDLRKLEKKFKDNHPLHQSVSQVHLKYLKK